MLIANTRSFNLNSEFSLPEMSIAFGIEHLKSIRFDKIAVVIKPGRCFPGSKSVSMLWLHQSVYRRIVSTHCQGQGWIESEHCWEEGCIRNYMSRGYKIPIREKSLGPRRMYFPIHPFSRQCTDMIPYYLIYNKFPDPLGVYWMILLKGNYFLIHSLGTSGTHPCFS